MSEIEAKIVGFGLLCLVGGVLLFCLGYSDPLPSLGSLLFSALLIFLGIASIYGGLKTDVGLKTTTASQTKPAPPPPAASAPVSPRMYCAWCGAELRGGYRFCEKCGKEASR